MFEGIGRIPLTRYNICPRIRRTLRKNAAVAIIVTATVSFIVLVLGSYINYLIAIRSQNTENVISYMYMDQTKSQPNNYRLSTNKLDAGNSLGGSGILTIGSRDEHLQTNTGIYAVLSFILFVITSLTTIIRSYLCAPEFRSHPFKESNDGQKQGVAIRTSVYVSVGTNTPLCAEADFQIC